MNQARFPFLDEDVIRTLLDIPLWKVANLSQPSGIGDKKILREVNPYFFCSKYIVLLNVCGIRVHMNAEFYNSLTRLKRNVRVRSWSKYWWSLLNKQNTLWVVVKFTTFVVGIV